MLELAKLCKQHAWHQIGRSRDYDRTPVQEAIYLIAKDTYFQL